MAYALDLTSACAKFMRGKMHIDNLAARISEAGPESKLLPLRQQYEAEERCVVIRVERVEKIPDQWSLIAGDAVHNLRGSLDHLAWQLAKRYFDGGEPPEKNAGNIQFPVVYSKGEWQRPATNRTFMLDSDADKLKRFQPFYTDIIDGVGLNLFESFFGKPRPGSDGPTGVSNVDKHRTIEIAYVLPHTGRIKLLDPPFEDCTQQTITTPTSQGVASYYTEPSDPPRPGDKVLAIPVVVTGPNPRMNLEVSLGAKIAIRKSWLIPDSLYFLAQAVKIVLNEFGANLPDE